MGWIEVEGLEPGWWKGWKLWVFLIGFAVLAFGFYRVAEGYWPLWLGFPIMLAFLVLSLATSSPRQPRTRWDTERGEHVEYHVEDGDNGDSGGDCGGD